MISAELIMTVEFATNDEEHVSKFMRKAAGALGDFLDDSLERTKLDGGKGYCSTIDWGLETSEDDEEVD